jgi:hypothetical protein
MSLDEAALDTHIERLREGGTLTENEVKALCDKASLRICLLFMTRIVERSVQSEGKILVRSVDTAAPNDTVRSPPIALTAFLTTFSPFLLFSLVFIAFMLFVCCCCIESTPDLVKLSEYSVYAIPGQGNFAN